MFTSTAFRGVVAEPMCQHVGSLHLLVLAGEGTEESVGDTDSRWSLKHLQVSGDSDFFQPMESPMNFSKIGFHGDGLVVLQSSGLNSASAYCSLWRAVLIPPAPPAPACYMDGLQEPRGWVISQLFEMAFLKKACFTRTSLFIPNTPHRANPRILRCHGWSGFVQSSDSRWAAYRPFRRPVGPSWTGFQGFSLSTHAPLDPFRPKEAESLELF